MLENGCLRTCGPVYLPPEVALKSLKPLHGYLLLKTYKQDLGMLAGQSCPCIWDDLEFLPIDEYGSLRKGPVYRRLSS